MPAEPRFFDTPADFRDWLRINHATAGELLIGFHKAHTNKPGMTGRQAIPEALCYGWIDGQLRSLGDEAYCVRYTPRRKGSKWSAVNIRLIAQLDAQGRLAPAGRATFEARPHKTGPLAQGYKAQKKIGALDPARLTVFKKNNAAWTYYAAQPPSYQKATAWWVMQAKQEETRDRRLAKLIKFSAGGKRVV